MDVESFIHPFVALFMYSDVFTCSFHRVMHCNALHKEVLVLATLARDLLQLKMLLTDEKADEF